MFVDSITEISSKVILDFYHRYGDFSPADLKVLWTPFWSAAIRNGELPQDLASQNRQFKAP
jgi:hypothetical protein